MAEYVATFSKNFQIVMDTSLRPEDGFVQVKAHYEKGVGTVEGRITFDAESIENLHTLLGRVIEKDATMQHRQTDFFKWAQKRTGRAHGTA